MKINVHHRGMCLQTVGTLCVRIEETWTWPRAPVIASTRSFMLVQCVNVSSSTNSFTRILSNNDLIYQTLANNT